MVFFADYLVPQIVFLGDSLTQFSANFTNGIIPRLQNEYQRQYDVVNRGFSGYNSEWVNELAEPVFAGLSHAPIDYSVIFLGTNDLADNKLQHVGINEYAEYLENIVDISNAYTNNTIVVGPAIVNEDLWADRSNLDFYAYSQAAKAVAAKAGVPFVDLYAAFHKFFNESTTPHYTIPSDVKLNVTALNASAPLNVTAANSTVWVSNFTKASNVTKRSAPDAGYIAGFNTSLNDTVLAANTTQYPVSNKTYIGKKGNPKNKLLSQVLIDGLHFNNRGYDIFYKALKPYLNSSASYWPAPYYKNINTTEYLNQYLERSYLAGELQLNETSTGEYFFAGYNLSNLTVGNTTFGNVSLANFTESFANYTGNLTNITVISPEDEVYAETLQQAIEY